MLRRGTSIVVANGRTQLRVEGWLMDGSYFGKCLMRSEKLQAVLMCMYLAKCDLLQEAHSSFGYYNDHLLTINGRDLMQ